MLNLLHFNSGALYDDTMTRCGSASNTSDIVVSDVFSTDQSSGLTAYRGLLSLEVAQAPIPEPATIALLGIGLVGLAGAEVRRRRKKRAVENS